MAFSRRHGPRTGWNVLLGGSGRISPEHGERPQSLSGRLIDPGSRASELIAVADLRIPRLRLSHVPAPDHTGGVSQRTSRAVRSILGWALAIGIGCYSAATIFAPDSEAEPPPLPPSQPRVPGAQSAPFGPLQLTPPAFVNGPPREQVDARGAGISSLSQLGGPVETMPNAKPGPATRIAVGVAGPGAAFSSSTLSDIDHGALAAPEAPPAAPPAPVVTAGIDLSAPPSLPITLVPAE